MPIFKKERVLSIKSLVDSYLPEGDGFESYLFQVGPYNNAVSDDFRLNIDPKAAGILILSTPNMFDISFRRWITQRVVEIGSFSKAVEDITSPIQEFMIDRLKPILENLDIPFQLFHDHSLWPNRKPKILMQTCGHVSGAAFYYQPQFLVNNTWPPAGIMDANSVMTIIWKNRYFQKFIGLSLHPIYGGHFAFRSVIIFPECLVEDLAVNRPISILTSDDEARKALEKFNYSWRDSGFRDFGRPKIRYSSTQVEFFSKPPAERWNVLLKWFPDCIQI